MDCASLTKLIGYLRQEGVHEYFVVGSTGEAPLLDDTDRTQIIETVRAAAPDGFIYAGVSGMGSRSAIRLARESARAGANAAVLMCPYFLAFNQDQLAAYCESVADEIPLPLTLYHHLRMPTPFAVPTVARLAAHPNIVALKDTSGGDHNRCAEILSATAGRDFQFYQGVEKLVLPTLEAGGHGCVVAQACIAPGVFRRLFDAWERGDGPAADAAQQEATRLWTIFSRTEVRQSFCHFLHTLKLPLHQRGVLATTSSAMPGPRFQESFERMITDFMRQHLDAAAVSPNA